MERYSPQDIEAKWQKKWEEGKVYKTEADELLPMKLVIHKAVPQAAFSLALSNTGDPSTLSMTFDLFAVDGNDFLDMQLIEG